MTSNDNSGKPTVIGTMIGTNIGTAETIINLEDIAYDVSGLPNPYLGLRSYTYDDRVSYAGRRRAVEDAVQKLTLPGEQRSLLFITGASGSGKSSFVSAGLLPALERHYSLRGLAARWALFRPSHYPIAGLIDAVSQLELPTQLLDREALTKMSDAFHWFLEKNTPENQVNILIIDQFEELFTQSDFAERDALLQILERFPHFDQLHTHVIAVIRADYLKELFERPVLYDLAKQGLDIRAMNTAELKEAIQQPLFQKYPQNNKRFESDLLEKLAQDSAKEASYLPLLQVTLADIWSKGKLRVNAYHTLTDAIQQRAEDVYLYADYGSERQQRSTEDQTTIMQIFLDLVDVSLDNDPRRDARLRRTYIELALDSLARARLIEDLCNERLLSKGLETQNEKPVEVVDIIHETLINNWPRLKQAIADQRLALQQRVRFKHALQEWQANKKADNYLLDGVRLEEAHDLDLRRDVVVHSSDAQDFLQRSIVRREEQRQRDLRRTRIILAIVSVLSLIAIMAAIFGFYGQQLAQQKTNDAQAAEAQAVTSANEAKTAQAQLQTKLVTAEAQRLAFAAESEIDSSPETAVLLAYEAVQRERSPVTEQALRDSIEHAPGNVVTLKGHTDGVISITFSPDGQRVLTASYDKTARLWSLSGELLATFSGHTDSLRSAVFSPDGQRILTASEDKTAALWNLSGQRLMSFVGHTDKVWRATFNADGQHILTVSNDGTARLWNVNGQTLTTFGSSSNEILNATFSPDGKYIITPVSNQTTRLWDLSGNLITTFNNTYNSWQAAQFSPDSQHVLTTQADGTAQLWSISGQPLVTLKDSANSIDSALFSPDGKHIFTANGSYLVKQWDLNGQQIGLIKAHFDDIESIVLNQDGSKVLALPDDKSVAGLWDASGELIANLSGYTGEVLAGTFSPDGSYVATTSSDGAARLWDVSGYPLIPLIGHTDSLNDMIFSSDGQQIVTASSDHTARLWDLFGHSLVVFRGHTDSVRSVAFSPNQQYILTNSDDHTARLWNLSGQTIATFGNDSVKVSGAGFSPNGQYILTTSDDGITRLWSYSGNVLVSFKYAGDNFGSEAMFNPNGQQILTISSGVAHLWDLSGKLLASFGSQSNSVREAFFSPDGQQILTSSDGTTAYLWDLSGKLLASFGSQSTPVQRAYFSPDGQQIFTVSKEHSVRIWNTHGDFIAKFDVPKSEPPYGIAFSSDKKYIVIDVGDYSPQIYDLSGKLIATLNGHTNSINSIVFSPNGQYILTSSYDQTVRLWDLSGQVVATFIGHNDEVENAKFSPDGKRVIVTTLTGLIRQYFVNIDDLLRVAPCRVGRSLNDEEIARFQVSKPLHFDFTKRQCPPVVDGSR